MPQEKITLRQRIQSGKRIILSEIAPPADANAAYVKDLAKELAGKVHAVGISDNRNAIRMSALAAASIAVGEGVETILHMATRDKNRAALVSDCLGAHALGIYNILCTSGTHQSLLPFSTVKNVYDIDATVLLQSCKEIEKEKKLQQPFCLGAVVSPFADPVELQLVRMAQKIHVGSCFVITQPVFDRERFTAWCENVVSRHLHEKAACIAGIRVLTDVRRAKEFAASRPLPMVPDSVIGRLEKSKDARKEGIALACETVDGVLSTEGIRGVEIVCEEDQSAAIEVLQHVKSELE